MIVMQNDRGRIVSEERDAVKLKIML